MPDRGNLEIDGLEASEGALDAGQILVGLHALGAAHRVGRQAGSDDIEPVATGLSRDAVELAAPGEAAVANIEGEVPGHLVAVQAPAPRPPPRRRWSYARSP